MYCFVTPYKNDKYDCQNMKEKWKNKQTFVIEAEESFLSSVEVQTKCVIVGYLNKGVSMYWERDINFRWTISKECEKWNKECEEEETEKADPREGRGPTTIHSTGA